ncbi:MAG: glycosyltransferase family 2 protein [Candidatus Omnitrophota bacterium]
MKLIIQIACFNEEETLPVTLNALPKQLDGIDEIEVLIINDGSTDRTAAIAEEHGVDYIISFKKNQGLARSFMAGLNACLKFGADIIVHTDADNQYNADDIPKLIKPILEERADMVIGARPISRIDHFSFIKKVMQKLGSWLVRKVSRTTIEDAPSGFRAISQNGALKLNVFNNFTYTHETILQFGLKNMAVISVPIRVNETLRPSRLFKSIPSYIARSLLAILRMMVVYRPFRFFLSIGLMFLTLGIIFILRYLYFLLFASGAGHIQSVVLAGVSIGIGFQMILVAFMADLLGVNRRLLEEIQYRLRKQELNKDGWKKKPGCESMIHSDF